MNYSKFIESIFTINQAADFEGLALELFHYQAKENEVYRSYLDLLKIDTQSIHKLVDIPYLPIEFFKSQDVVSGEWKAEFEFHSSGTTDQVLSVHQVRDVSIYKQSFVKGFEYAYGALQEYILLCLLPNYQENPHSSLIYMTDELIQLTDNPLSGYYLDWGTKLQNNLSAAIASDKRVILFGVSYALLDLADKVGQADFKSITVMETGGMKGNRKEMVKKELHSVLKMRFGVEEIHSEYGMTELLSQAYSKGEGQFYCPPWMSVSVRDVNDPFNKLEKGRSGGLNIVDLANVHSCAFIATQDLGKVSEDGSFELLGRYAHSDIRGCNLLIAD